MVQFVKNDETSSRPGDAGVSARGPGSVALPTDAATAARFLTKCAPYDDQGHRWWLGAIDGGADRTGGYGRFKLGSVWTG